MLSLLFSPLLFFVMVRFGCLSFLSYYFLSLISFSLRMFSACSDLSSLGSLMRSFKADGFAVFVMVVLTLEASLDLGILIPIPYASCCATSLSDTCGYCFFSSSLSSETSSES